MNGLNLLSAPMPEETILAVSKPENLLAVSKPENLLAVSKPENLSLRHRGNTFFRARYSILLVSGTHQQNYKMPATFSCFRPDSERQRKMH